MNQKGLCFTEVMYTLTEATLIISWWTLSSHLTPDPSLNQLPTPAPPIPPPARYSWAGPAPAFKLTSILTGPPAHLTSQQRTLTQPLVTWQGEVHATANVRPGLCPHSLRVFRNKNSNELVKPQEIVSTKGQRQGWGKDYREGNRWINILSCFHGSDILKSLPTKQSDKNTNSLFNVHITYLTCSMLSKWLE